jgi:hypothetical protein
LRWHAQGVAFVAKHGTVHDLARQVGASVHCVRRILYATQPVKSNSRSRRRLGRRPDLSLRERALVRRWQRAWARFRARRVTAAQLAGSLGISRSTLYDCIQRQGHYAQTRLTGKGDRADAARPVRYNAPASESDVAARAALLREWSPPLRKCARGADSATLRSRQRQAQGRRS